MKKKTKGRKKNKREVKTEASKTEASNTILSEHDLANVLCEIDQVLLLFLIIIKDFQLTKKE